jgi:hypothetical protein
MTKFNSSKDHLVPVGTKQLIKSDQYGNYVMRCVANLDLFPPGIKTLEFLSWVDKFHPKNLGFGYKLVGSNSGEEDRFISVLFVMQEDNLDWYANNKDSKYVQQVKKKVSLPIACTNKELQKFLEGSKRLLLP